jgi:adenylate kinase
MGKRLLIFGPPGAGKGTHAKRLASELGIPHIATGDMFREAIQHGTTSGLQAAEFMNRGELVPDPLAVSVLSERLARDDADCGYLLDGFPRTVPQAEVLDQRLRKAGQGIDSVLSLEVPEEVLVERLAGRLICARCGRSYNRLFRAPVTPGRCDACGGTLYQRPDDGQATVRRRFAEYQAKTAPVLDFCRSVGWTVCQVRSVGEIDEVFGRIRQAVGD